MQDFVWVFSSPLKPSRQVRAVFPGLPTAAGTVRPGLIIDVKKNDKKISLFRGAGVEDPETNTSTDQFSTFCTGIAQLLGVSALLPQKLPARATKRNDTRSNQVSGLNPSCQNSEELE